MVLSALAGYATSFAIESQFRWEHFCALVLGTFFLSAGSLALNQVQEYKTDQKMPRTQKRPVASGKISPHKALAISIFLLGLGSLLLFRASNLSGILGWATVILYNGFYTYWWKPKWVFAAIPGAIPGALPVTLGYAANDPQILNKDSVYLFLIMFLWQMPHFWALAVRYKDDYTLGGVPTLPAALGLQKTFFHMGLWTFFYVIIAVASPWFVRASWVYVLLVLPFAFKVLQEFWRYFKSDGKERWLAYFMWVNLSMLIFIFVPVVDKWSFLFLEKV